MARAKIVSDHVTVRVLGATEITVGTRRIGMSTEALFALALYLTTRAGERVPREDVLETFWPGGEEESRRHAMRQMLYRLRQKGFAFDEDGDTLRLDPAKVESDLRTCLEPSWPESATPAGVDAALSLGPTFSTRLPRPFLEWFDGVRTDVSHQARKAAMQLIATSRSQGRWADLDRWAKAVLAIDPLNEEATLARAEAAAMSGAKNLALEILDGYLAELGDVDSSVGKPAQQLRKRIAERRASWIPTGPREVALIGREEEMSALTQAVEAALQGKSRSVLLVGPSGYGKSRLLAEAREYAALRGVRCVVVRAEATLASHPLSVVREICRALITQPGAAAIDPAAMSVVQSLIREDTNQGAGLSFSPVTTSEEIRRTLASLVEAVSHESCTLLTIDDAQNSDEQSLAIIYELVVDIQNGRCSCALATHPATQLRPLKPSGRFGLQVYRLSPLTHDLARALAAATALAHNTVLPDAALDRIARRSGGHPLFARELTLSYFRTGPTHVLPSTLADVVSRTLSRQTADSIRVLRIVALLASTATVSRVQRVAGLERSHFLDSVDVLSQEGVLQLDQARTLRIHDCWRDSIISSTPDAVAATLALECATALQEDSAAGSIAVQGRLADLFRLGGEPDRSVRFRLESIDSLLASGLYDSALDATQRELALDYGITIRARLGVRQAVALLATGHPEQSLPIADEIWRSRVLQTSQDISDHLLAVGVSADCHVKLDIADRGPAAELLALAGTSSLSVSDIARACLWGLRLLSNSPDHSSMSEFVQRLRRVSLEPRSPTVALVELIFAAELGSVAQISEAYDRLRMIDQQGLSMSDRCLLLRCAAHALRVGGFIDEAAATGEASHRLAEANGLSYAARLSAELLCNMHLDYGRIPAARKWLDLLSALSATGGYGNTHTSYEHVRDRLDLAAGQTTGLQERVRSRVELVRSFGNTHGKFGELALSAAILASTGEHAEASELLSEALHGARILCGRPIADFIADTCLMASRKTNLRQEAEAVAKSHLSNRLEAGKPPIAPAFTHLLQLAQTLPGA